MVALLVTTVKMSTMLTGANFKCTRTFKSEFSVLDLIQVLLQSMIYQSAMLYTCMSLEGLALVSVKYVTLRFGLE